MTKKPRFSFSALFIAMFLFGLSIDSIAQGGMVAHVADEAVELFAKRAARASVLDSSSVGVRAFTERLASKFGDDAVRLAMRDGGPELIEAVAIHGDDLMELAMKASPAGRRALAGCASELLPHIRRVGISVLELEANAPGLASRFIRVFGDETTVALAKSVPKEDLPRLLRMAESADSPATRDLLVKGYADRGAALLDKIPPKLVVASGLSAAMVIVAWEGTSPFRSIASSIEENPDLAREAINEFAGASVLLISVIGLTIIGAISAVAYLGLRRFAGRRAS